MESLSKSNSARQGNGHSEHLPFCEIGKSGGNTHSKQEQRKAVSSTVCRPTVRVTAYYRGSKVRTNTHTYTTQREVEEEKRWISAALAAYSPCSLKGSEPDSFSSMKSSRSSP